jgi:hypothetical protein
MTERGINRVYAAATGEKILKLKNRVVSVQNVKNPAQERRLFFVILEKSNTVKTDIDETRAPAVKTKKRALQRAGPKAERDGRVLAFGMTRQPAVCTSERVALRAVFEP